MENVTETRKHSLLGIQIQREIARKLSLQYTESESEVTQLKLEFQNTADKAEEKKCVTSQESTGYT